MSQTRTDDKTHQEQIEKLNELIHDIEFAMLVTAETDGTLRSRPMATQKREFAGELWFFTKASAPKVDEVEHDHHINVAYAAPAKQRYVSISGTAKVVRDRAKIEELWTPDLKAYFPDGVDDPDIALLHIRPSQAEYWDAPSSSIVYFAGMAKAVLQGETYRPGENEKIDL